MKYDRMASRLAIIISRLFMGETLSVRLLSEEFTVSERTLRRDFRERLVHLDLQYRRGHYSLSKSQRGVRSDRDIIHFSRVTCTEQLFPAMDSKLISILINNTVDSPYNVYLSPPDRKPTLFGGFYRITQAILDRVMTGLTVGGRQYRKLAPYKLIYFENCWYLVGECNRKLQVFTLESITDVYLTRLRFLRKRHIDELIGDQHFIKSLPHFQFVRKVLADTEQ
ncbi:WYL domain-containing protein [Pectobacteriaceae bacterium CE90]|nr:WYL domain-containing protein [Pectobacteriaceae bacterium CE90]